MLLLENISHDSLKEFIKEFYNYALTKLKIDRSPKLMFISDKQNADDFLGKTGYYDPEEEKIALFIIDRHAKDVLRSFAHELIHHEQKCRGSDKTVDLTKTATDPAYATNDPKLREMEREAFERGNMLFRDWCDMKKVERKKNMNESKLVEAILEKVIKHLQEKEMTKGEIKKAHKIGKAVARAGSAKEPFAVGMAAVKKGAKEMDEASKPDFLDLDKDGNKKEPMKKAAKDSKKMSKKKTMKETGTGFGEGPEGKENLQESKEKAPVHPYPELFQKKDRLMKDRFNKYEELIYQELLKRTIKEQK